MNLFVFRRMEWPLVTAGGLATFFVMLLCVVMSKPKIFVKRYGRNHRILGGCNLVWLLVGVVWLICDLFRDDQSSRYSIMAYDSLLGILGTITTLSAARDFKKVHERVNNAASGTLEPEATVTYAEMIEHSFYQGLNLVQILFIHTISSSPQIRVIQLLLVTFPWFIRHWFPVHSFRENYKKNDPWKLTSILYRVKKYQYVFYKHALLHGLNITIALSGHQMATTMMFRLYWMALNSSYVMEFFLQTLVKKKVMSQSFLLFLQTILMASSSIATLPLLIYLPIYIPIVSCCVNFVHRGHDVVNTISIFFLFCFVFWFTPHALLINRSI